jgi:hypothetical protein
LRRRALTHGSIREFLRDPLASLNVVTMYVAVKLSIEYETSLVRDSERALRGVHLTDGTSVIVMITRRAHITYEECAPFLLSDIGFANGALVSPWRRIVIVRDARSTLGAELELIMGTYAIDKLIDTAELEACLSMLVAAHPIAALLDESDDSDEFDDSDEDAPEQAPDQAQDLGAAAGHDDDALDHIDVGALDLYVMIDALRAHYEEHGALPKGRDTTLGRWTASQRTNRDRMSAERKGALEALTFWTWNVNDTTWDTNFNAYVMHFETHGKVPPKTAEFLPLNQWGRTQRRPELRYKLTPEQIDRLTALPFWAWIPGDPKWDTMFDQLALLGALPTEDGPLKRWVDYHSKHCDKLRKDRKDKLRALPFWR